SVMGPRATQEQGDGVAARRAEAGCSAFVTPGREATVIGATGERERLATLPLEGFAGVEQVLPILKPYKLVSRELSPDPTVIEVRGRRIGDDAFGLIAGPCTVEYREQTLETARAVAHAGSTMLRGGAFKPRTSPYTFSGLGEEALTILVEAREETGLPIVTELMDPRHVDAVLEHADVIQIGARNMQNFNLLSEVGRADKPVLLKRGPAASIEELLMAAEYVVKEGNAQVILCERGITTFERATRYTLDISAIPVLKQEWGRYGAGTSIPTRSPRRVSAELLRLRVRLTRPSRMRRSSSSQLRSRRSRCRSRPSSLRRPTAPP